MKKSKWIQIILIISVMVISGVPAQAQNQAGVNQPIYGQTGQSQIIYPSAGQVQPGQVQSGQPLAVYPPSGQVQPGQVQPGQPLAVYPPSGQVQPGQVQPGQPMAAYPSSGQVQPGQARPGQMPAGQPQAAQQPSAPRQVDTSQPAPAADNPDMPVVIYGKHDCPSTKAALKAHPNHIFLDLDKEPQRLDEVQSLTGGERVWPVIIRNQHIIIGWKGGVCGEQNQ